MSAAGDKRTVSGGPRPPDTVLIWDLPVRVFHWTLVASIVTAFLTTDGLGKIHRFAGYIAVSLLIFRIVWGFAGTRYARFSDFVRGPRAVLKYTADELTGFADRKLGHNPAGGAMILALLLVVAGIGTTGIMMRTERFFGSETVETVHWMLAYSLFVLVPLHVLGVILASASHKENLALAMLTGRKPRQGTPGEEEAASRELDTKLRGTAALALVAILAVVGTLAWPQVMAQIEVLEKRRAAVEAAEAKHSTTTVSGTIADASASATASEPEKAAKVSKPAEIATQAKSTDAAAAPTTGDTTANQDTVVAGKSTDEGQGETLGRELAEAEQPADEPATTSSVPDIPERMRAAVLTQSVDQTADQAKDPALVAEALGRATSREIADASAAVGSAEAFEPAANAEPSQEPGSSADDEQAEAAEDDGTATAGLVNAPTRKSKPAVAANARSNRSTAQATVRAETGTKKSIVRAAAAPARKAKRSNARSSKLASAPLRVGKPTAAPSRTRLAKNRQALAGARTTRVRATAVRTRVARTGRAVSSRKRPRSAFVSRTAARIGKSESKGKGKGRGSNSGKGSGNSGKGSGNSGKGGGGNSGSGGGNGGHGGGDD